MKRYFLLVIASLIGCESTNYCSYPLTEKGWEEVGVPPVNLVKDYSKDFFWFTNDNGDYVACTRLIKKGVCGNTLEIYEKMPDGTFKQEDIGCIE